MMTIVRKPSHHFYSVFQVEDWTFQDIGDRLNEINLLAKHLLIDEFGEEVIVFGSTGFKREQSQF